MKTEQLGRFTYRWSEGCFPLSPDSLALGEFCDVQKRSKVTDLGCGAGLLLLLCARRQPEASLFGVELDPEAAALARENLAANGLAGEIVTGDLRTAALPEKQDLVVCNPPWYRSGQAGDRTRVEESSLGELCQTAYNVLRHKGRFAIVYDPARLVELLGILRICRLEPKRMQFCRHAPDRPPYAVLVEAVKNGRTGLEVLPDLI